MLVRFIKSGKIKNTSAGELFIRIGIAEEVKTDDAVAEEVKVVKPKPANPPKKESKKKRKPAKRGRPRKK